MKPGKKIVTLAAIVALVVVAAAGMLSTGAWFTDSANAFTGGTVNTGSLDLNVNNISGFVVNNLEPGAGYVPLGRFCANNVGAYNMKWRGWLLNEIDPNGLIPYLSVKAIINPAGLVGNYGPSNTELWTDVPASTLQNPNTYILMNDPGWYFTPGSQACYEIQVQLSAAATNAQQNATFQSDLYLEATQRINPGW